MIRYALRCDQGHGFESWFNSSNAFESQAARGLISCPACGSAKVEKAIMAPAVGKPEQRPVSAAPEEPKAPVAILSDNERVLRSKLRELRDHIVKNADYVGRKFPEEARGMHYGDIEHRSIYGEASAEDAAALIEEGIELHPLPILPDERN